MRIHPETVKEFGKILVHLGQVAVISGVATAFAGGFPRLASAGGVGIGIILILSGLYFVNQANLEE